MSSPTPTTGTKEIIAKLSVGKLSEANDIKQRLAKKYGKVFADGFDNGFRYARNYLQRKKTDLLKEEHE